MLALGQVQEKLVICATSIILVAVAVTLVPLTTRERLKTTDFQNFYLGGSIVRQGKGSQLYRRETQNAAYQSMLGYQPNQYFLHPPFEAAALAPLTTLSMEHAFVVWTLINVALLGCLPLLLMPCVAFVQRNPFLTLLLLFCFLPVLIALNLGQDSILLLFVASWAYFMICKGKTFRAGLVLALLGLKFQYLAIIAILLLLSRKFRLLSGVALGVGCLTLLSGIVTGSRGLVDYVRFVQSFNAHDGYGALNPSLMVNARGFFAGLGYGTHASEYGLMFGLLLFGATSLLLLRRRKFNVSLLFAYFIVVAILVSPYAHFPDTSLILLPILLAFDHASGKADSSIRSRLIMDSCIAMLLVPYLLIAFGTHYWWDSHIFLIFPVILLFAGSLALELWCESVRTPGFTTRM